MSTYLGKHPKTVHHFDWEQGHTVVKHLTRSFDTLDEARRFADGKQVVDIYKSKGRFKVEWIKTIDNYS